MQINKTVALAYGVFCYLVFFVAFVYALGFLANPVVPKSIDSGPEGSFALSLLVDLLLLGLFAVQHSVMARPRFKKWWTRFVPPVIERSTYVLFTSLIFLLLFWQWQPLPGLVWDLNNTPFGPVMWGLYGLGWLIVFFSIFMVSHFDLFGLRQVFLYQRGKPITPLAFKTAFLYRFVRHPLMLGFIIAFWATPVMTFGHLLFALAATGYILVGVQLEERDLTNYYGDTYHKYRQQVPMLLPLIKRK